MQGGLEPGDKAVGRLLLGREQDGRMEKELRQGEGGSKDRRASIPHTWFGQGKIWQDGKVVHFRARLRGSVNHFVNSFVSHREEVKGSHSDSAMYPP